MDRNTLYEKIYACWQGKLLGRGAVAEVEDAYPHAEVDLQLLNLHAMESYGTRMTAEHIAAEWSEHCFLPWDEFGHAVTALRLGFKPPFSGAFDNHFIDCMGGVIRAELWAAVAAGNPKLAAYLAREDALVDHSGGEGMYGEIFLAVLESMAYELADVPALIREALTFIPADSRVSQTVSHLLSLYEQGIDAAHACNEIETSCGRTNSTDAPQNIAYILAGLLWGHDVDEAMAVTVRAGGTAVSNAAACGAVWGILYGHEGLTSTKADLSDASIQLSDAVRGFRIPADVGELTRRCVALHAKFACEDEQTYAIPCGKQEDLTVQHFTLPQDANPSEAFCVDIRYEDDDPTVAPERPQNLRITLTNHTDWPWTIEARMECPYGLAADVPAQILVAPGESVSYSPMVKADTNAYYSIPVDRVYPVVLAIKRLNCGDRWKIYRLPIPLLIPNRWILNGKPVLVPATTVSFTEKAQDGVYVAEATLSTPPVTRETRMICNCVWPTTVELDGDVIMHTETPSPFLPAYHRVPEDQRRDGILQRGFHKVKVTVRMPEDARDILPTFVVSFHAPEQVTEPGNFYAYTDIHFAR